MAKRKKNMFKCPLCGFVSWDTRLENSHYPLDLVKVKSDGRGLIKHLFFAWDVQNPLRSVFEKHFYDVLGYLLRHRYINARTVKDLANLYLAKSPQVFHPEMIFNPDVVYNPEVVYTPKVVE